MIALAVLVFVAALPQTSAIFGFESFTIEEAHDCAQRKCDFDGNGLVTELEVLFIFEVMLEGTQRWAAYRVSSPKQAIEDCGDTVMGHISEKTFANSKQCLRGRGKMLMFKSLVCNIFPDISSDPELQSRYTKFARQDHSSELVYFRQ